MSPAPYEEVTIYELFGQVYNYQWYDDKPAVPQEEQTPPEYKLDLIFPGELRSLTLHCISLTQS